jgi:acetolactate synthase-1/2/3 large subunit
MPTVAENLIKILSKSGVRFVFGIPSVHNIPIYEALRKDETIQHILCRQETTACHIADGFARAMWCNKQVNGVPSVVIASTGPGTSYLVPAVQEAFESSSPLLIVTTNIPSESIGKRSGSLHELISQDTIFHNITKKTICVKNVESIVSDTEKALKLAVSERPGPVYLEIPTNILDKTFHKINEHISVTHPNNHTIHDLEKTFDLLEKARRPLIIVGNSALRAGLSEEIRTLAKALCAPIITTTQSKGIIKENSELSFGNAAQKGLVQEIAKNSDLAIAIGTRLREVDGKRRGLNLPKLIHIDWDDTWMNRNFPVSIALIGDIHSILSKILKKIKPDPEKIIKRYGLPN